MFVVVCCCYMLLFVVVLCCCCCCIVVYFVVYFVVVCWCMYVVYSIFLLCCQSYFRSFALLFLQVSTLLLANLDPHRFSLSPPSHTSPPHMPCCWTVSATQEQEQQWSLFSYLTLKAMPPRAVSPRNMQHSEHWGAFTMRRWGRRRRWHSPQHTKSHQLLSLACSIAD